jgi:hypothetical protein
MRDDAVQWLRKTSTMMIDSFATLAGALRSSWGPETCDPVDLADWHPGNPTRGQCGVTVLVVNDLLGGDLVMAEVSYVDGTKQGVLPGPGEFGGGPSSKEPSEDFGVLGSIGEHLKALR